jgi:hypothetical protein
MKLIDLPYVIVTALVGLACFGVGRWSTPSHREVVYVPTAPVVVQTAPEVMIPPPPPVPVVTPVPEMPVIPVGTAHYEPDSGVPVEIGDNLMPILKKTVPMPMVTASVHPIVTLPVVPAVAPKQPVKPEPIVLEEIPDNPYAHKK